MTTNPEVGLTAFTVPFDSRIGVTRGNFPAGVEAGAGSWPRFVAAGLGLFQDGGVVAVSVELACLHPGRSVTLVKSAQVNRKRVS